MKLTPAARIWTDFNRRPNTEERQDGEDHTDDASGEVVHQHLKNRFDLTVYPTVEFLHEAA